MSDITRINELTDHILRMQMQETSLSADLKRVKASIALAETELIVLMLNNNLTSVGSQLATAEIGTKIVPTVVNWAETYEHIQHTGDFDLLHRRISATAFNERLKAGVVVPGIEARSLTTVKIGSLT
jgi:hypothetical protein